MSSSRRITNGYGQLAANKRLRALKAFLIRTSSITHYETSLEATVAAGASEHGLGAVIQHRWSDGSVKAVAHASCSLKSAEQNYSQIEKEGLALIFGIKKFHKYITEDISG
jgi:hypothetical protein